MRCFMAVEFDRKTKAALEGVQGTLRTLGVRGNYSLPDNLHLTLKFLGEVPESQLQPLTGLMEKVASHHREFVLSFGQLGKFSKGSKSILWLGLEASQALLLMQGELDNELLKHFPGNLERSGFSPHITLVREAVLPDSGGQTPEEAFQAMRTASGIGQPDYRVREISLMESTRVDGKLCYRRKSSASLMACDR